MLSSTKQRLWKEGHWGVHMLRRFEPTIISKSALCISIFVRHLIANIFLQWEGEAAVTYTAARQTLPSACQLSKYFLVELTVCALEC